jgi:hypothetical protein
MIRHICQKQSSGQRKKKKCQLFPFLSFRIMTFILRKVVMFVLLNPFSTVFWHPLVVFLSLFFAFVLSVCLSVWLSVCLSVCLSVYLSVCLTVFLNDCLFTKTMDATRVIHKGIKVVPAPLVAPVVLLLLKIRWKVMKEDRQTDTGATNGAGTTFIPLCITRVASIVFVMFVLLNDCNSVV